VQVTSTSFLQWPRAKRRRLPGSLPLRLPPGGSVCTTVRSSPKSFGRYQHLNNKKTNNNNNKNKNNIVVIIVIITLIFINNNNNDNSTNNSNNNAFQLMMS